MCKCKCLSPQLNDAVESQCLLSRPILSEMICVNTLLLFTSCRSNNIEFFFYSTLCLNKRCPRRKWTEEKCLLPYWHHLAHFVWLVVIKAIKTLYRRTYRQIHFRCAALIHHVHDNFVDESFKNCHSSLLVSILESALEQQRIFNGWKNNCFLLFSEVNVIMCGGSMMFKQGLQLRQISIQKHPWHFIIRHWHATFSDYFN